MEKTIREVFQDVPKEKMKEVVEKLSIASDIEEMIAKAKEYGIIFDLKIAEKVFDMLKNITELSDEDLAMIAGGAAYR